MSQEYPEPNDKSCDDEPAIEPETKSMITDPKPNEEQTPSNDRSNDRWRWFRRRKKRTPEEVTARATKWIAAVTVVLGFVSIFQWQTMQDALRVSERAYVGVRKIDAQFSRKLIVVTFQNTGNIPANNVFIDVNQFREPLGASFDRHHRVAVGFSGLAHNLRHHQMLKGFDFQIPLDMPDMTPEAYRAILQEQELLQLFGAVTYFDGFEMQTSLFYFIYSPHKGDWLSASIGWRPSDFQQPN